MQYDRFAALIYTPPQKFRGPDPELLKYHPMGSVFRCGDGTYWKIREDTRGERYFEELKDKAIDEVLAKVRRPR